MQVNSIKCRDFYNSSFIFVLHFIFFLFEIVNNVKSEAFAPIWWLQAAVLLQYGGIKVMLIYSYIKFDVGL